MQLGVVALKGVKAFAASIEPDVSEAKALAVALFGGWWR